MMKLLMFIGAIFLTLRSSHGHNIEKRINASSQYGHNLENDGLELPPEVQIAVEGAGDRSRIAAKSLTPTSCLRLKVVYNRPFRNIFGSSTEQRIKSIIDGADKIFGYHGLSTRINLDVQEIIYDGSSSARKWAIESGRGNNPYSSNLFHPTVKRRIENDPDNDNIHHYIFLTGRTSHPAKGIAWKGTVCLPVAKYYAYKSSMIHYNDNIVSTVAHEIGHALGMDHDFTADANGNDCSGQGGVMDYKSVRDKWTSCSQAGLDSYMQQGGNCIQCSGGQQQQQQQCKSFGPPSTCDHFKANGSCQKQPIVKYYCKAQCGTCDLKDDFLKTRVCRRLKKLGRCKDPRYSQVFCMSTCPKQNK